MRAACSQTREPTLDDLREEAITSMAGQSSDRSQTSHQRIAIRSLIRSGRCIPSAILLLTGESARRASSGLRATSHQLAAVSVKLVHSAYIPHSAHCKASSDACDAL